MKVSKIKKGSYVIENLPWREGYIRVFLNENQLKSLRESINMILED
jgi:predicted nuclease of restriction endonuclease-like (RecB) superfamily